ncbi:MAG TPA: hypothetical protein HA306_01635 [Methanosarcina sp.]|nr:hypothetical protein [Methanosarcina sp.]
MSVLCKHLEQTLELTNDNEIAAFYKIETMVKGLPTLKTGLKIFEKLKIKGESE